jgi:hypothetical protein
MAEGSDLSAVPTGYDMEAALAESEGSCKAEISNRDTRTRRVCLRGVRTTNLDISSGVYFEANSKFLESPTRLN